MEFIVTEEFLSVCSQILKENKSEDEWSLIESDDMFQTENIVGGYDADENAFCFSYYDENRQEFWFQITLDEVGAIIQHEMTSVPIRFAD
jgi:hypothetical protein